MFPSVRAAIERGTVRLDKEGDSAGQPLPTVKEAFPLERGRAKTLNFAILYGKTAWGLSQDWGIELGAAQQIIDDWFEAYPEIRQWQARTQDEARQSGGVRTLLGRFRRLPAVRDVLSAQKRNHALRAAINTPVQGSAADIVTLAMLRLASCRYLLHEVGFHMVLQVHDEVVLEGPEARAEDALWQVRRLMEDPLPFGMAARLVVDARTAKNWHDAKPG
ncbi:unnamed protein product [Prorocentrum cordatum]|uniref:DNA-directed DNA polymerase family A palm domain-containing protein n=1 Tax=Prorocentrum cordatum TaxID=2364126 RepID=A0ABN9R5R5_9DINO|nr:unnamed protein product [Polarella glacialis]